MLDIRRRSPNPTISVLDLQYHTHATEDGPTHILEEIVWQKEREVNYLRDKTSLVELSKQLVNLPPTKDFVGALRSGQTHPAVIAEVKKASPSKGVIRENFDPVEIAQSYEQGGATCLSVLTDEKFFQGSFQYLKQVRAAVDLPLLCKDFMVYAYQICWARLHGADAILLIAAILTDEDMQLFLKTAKKLGMAALVEVHDLEELDRALQLEGVELIGINNRDLRDFSVNLNTTAMLIQARREALIAKNVILVGESGIHTPEDLRAIRSAGAQAVLVGESLMRQPDPGKGIKDLFAETAET
jgi:indole-3-glycerol phosphate synthase